MGWSRGTKEGMVRTTWGQQRARSHRGATKGDTERRCKALSGWTMKPEGGGTWWSTHGELSFEQARKEDLGQSHVRAILVLLGWRGIWRRCSPLEDLSFPFFAKCADWLSTWPGSLLVDAVGPESWTEAEPCLTTREPSLLAGV